MNNNAEKKRIESYVYDYFLSPKVQEKVRKLRKENGLPEYGINLDGDLKEQGIDPRQKLFPKNFGKEFPDFLYTNTSLGKTVLAEFYLFNRWNVAGSDFFDPIQVVDLQMLLIDEDKKYLSGLIGKNPIAVLISPYTTYTAFKKEMKEKWKEVEQIQKYQKNEKVEKTLRGVKSRTSNARKKIMLDMQDKPRKEIQKKIKEVTGQKISEEQLRTELSRLKRNKM